MFVHAALLTEFWSPFSTFRRRIQCFWVLCLYCHSDCRSNPTYWARNTQYVILPVHASTTHAFHAVFLTYSAQRMDWRCFSPLVCCLSLLTTDSARTRIYLSSRYCWNAMVSPPLWYFIVWPDDTFFRGQLFFAKLDRYFATSLRLRTRYKHRVK